MKSLRPLLVLLLLFAGASGVAAAADLSHTVVLVATDSLAGSKYEETVLVIAPAPQGGGHIGFIVNRPTAVKLQALFPHDPAYRKVVEPVYVGGPVLSEAIFALTRKAPAGDGTVIPLMPGLVAVFDSAGLHRIVKGTPNEARYFVGMMAWSAGELDEEIEAGAWEVQPAAVETVLAANPGALWKKLSGVQHSATRLLTTRSSSRPAGHA